jgi:hypothetical protein
MIDTFALVISHALLALAAWRLANRADLDRDGGERKAVWGQRGDA